MPSIDDLKRIAEVEFSDIVRETLLVDHKLRIFLAGNGFIDVNLSQRLPDKFGFHWEIMDIAGTIFRYDNFPDKNWSHISTYPCHFHNGSQNNVEASSFPMAVIEGFRAFLEFVKCKLGESAALDEQSILISPLREEDRNKKFKAALKAVNKKHGKTLKKLAE